MEKPFRFILLCHQRSGSNALSAMLNADPRVKLYGQLFNPFFRYWRRNRKMSLPVFDPHPEALRHFGTRPPLRPRLEHRFVQSMPGRVPVTQMADRFWSLYKRDVPLKAKGYKLHDYQVVDADLARLSTDHTDGVVMLSRTNLLRAAVSWAYAIKTDVWSSRSRVARPEHALDIDEVDWFVQKTRDEVARWRSTLDAAGANWIELNYERDIETRELAPLYAFLGLDYDGPPEFVTRRLASADYAHITNARHIHDRLASDANGHLFA